MTLVVLLALSTMGFLPMMMSGGARLVDPPVVVTTSPMSIGPVAGFSVMYCIAGS